MSTYCPKCNNPTQRGDKFCKKCGERICIDSSSTESQVSKEKANYPTQGGAQATTTISAPVSDMTYSDNKLSDNNIQTNSTKYRLNAWEFCWANTKINLFVGIISIILLFTGSGGMIIGLLLLFTVLLGFVCLYVTAGKNHYFRTSRSVNELVTAIDNYFYSKQRLSTRKWNRVSGQGDLNYEIEVVDFRNRGSGGLTSTVPIIFYNTDDGDTVAEVYISQWSRLNLGLTPRGTFKANSAINGLMKYLSNNA